MKCKWREKEKRIFLLGMALVLLAQLGLLFYYGDRKKGFHEDELYTYYSSNKTAGLFVEDRQWMSGESLRNELVVLPGEQFRYGVVKQMQSWDVHPPLYYYIFHTACSLFPGVFSKWLGIGVNLIAYVVCFLLLGYGSYTVSVLREEEEERKELGMALSFLTCLAWGFCPAVISGVMFIRMYQWLTLFVLLCLCLHVRALAREDFRIGSFFLPIAAVVFLGFSTQYYYIIFHFFLGLGFCVFLLRHKKKRELLLYVLFCALGLLAAVLYYPASLSHIFRGYRGTEAVSEFGNASNTWDRLTFFVNLFDDYVMNGMLAVFLLAICLIWLFKWYRARSGRKEPGRQREVLAILMLASGGYFFTVSKTALLLGETSNRYQLPIYGLLLFLLLYFVSAPFSQGGKGRKRGREALWILLGVILVSGSAVSLKNNKVFFLYEEDSLMEELIRENPDVPVVVCYHEASSDNIWRLANLLAEHPRVYLASLGNGTPISERDIVESDRLLVFAADYENQEQRLKELFSRNTHLTEGETVAEKGLWTLYDLRGKETGR